MRLVFFASTGILLAPLALATISAGDDGAGPAITLGAVSKGRVFVTKIVDKGGGRVLQYASLADSEVSLGPRMPPNTDGPNQWRIAGSLFWTVSRNTVLIPYKQDNLYSFHLDDMLDGKLSTGPDRRLLPPG